MYCIAKSILLISKKIPNKTSISNPPVLWFLYPSWRMATWSIYLMPSTEICPCVTFPFFLIALLLTRCHTVTCLWNSTQITWRVIRAINNIMPMSLWMILHKFLKTLKGTIQNNLTSQNILHTWTSLKFITQGLLSSPIHMIFFTVASSQLIHTTSFHTFLLRLIFQNFWNSWNFPTHARSYLSWPGWPSLV